MFNRHRDQEGSCRGPDSADSRCKPAADSAEFGGIDLGRIDISSLATHIFFISSTSIKKLLIFKTVSGRQGVLVSKMKSHMCRNTVYLFVADNGLVQLLYLEAFEASMYSISQHNILSFDVISFASDREA